MNTVERAQATLVQRTKECTAARKRLQRELDAALACTTERTPAQRARLATARAAADDAAAAMLTAAEAHKLALAGKLDVKAAGRFEEAGKLHDAVARIGARIGTLQRIQAASASGLEPAQAETLRELEGERKTRLVKLATITKGGAK
jgi:hypothetical protein